VVNVEVLLNISALVEMSIRLYGVILNKEKDALNVLEELDYQYVYDYFIEQGCLLLEDSYKNSDTKMKFICSCGNISYIRFGDFKDGQRCAKCGGTEKLTYEYVKNKFLERNYILLDDKYINNRTSLKYQCPAGHISSISYGSFAEGAGCMFCAGENRRGEKAYNWNSNLTMEDRIKNRDTLENDIWRRFVYERDKYICQLCGDKKGGNLVAHHLNSYTDFLEERFIVDNGITLCEDCHMEFHKIYTYYHNTKEQFEEFLLFKNNQIQLQQELKQESKQKASCF
jgi:hypothetical protein